MSGNKITEASWIKLLKLKKSGPNQPTSQSVSHLVSKPNHMKQEKLVGKKERMKESKKSLSLRNGIRYCRM